MGRLRKGYKQTEIGVIPEDWRVVELGRVGEVCMCKRVFKEQTSSSGDIPFYKIGTFGNSPDAYISQKLYDDYVQKYSFPKKGEVLFSAAGTIGRTVIFDGQPAYFQDSNIVWISNDEKTITNQFLFYFYKIVNWTTSDGGIVTRLYNDNIKNTQIPVPLDYEQRAIANVLNDIDSMIEALDKKIAKKQAIKEGAMQQLLTGKKHLQGFTEPWVEQKFEDILGKQIRKGELLTSSDYVEGTIPVIAGGKTPAGYHAFANRGSNTITISASGANAGFVAFHRNPIFATDCSTINKTEKFDIEFIYYLLCLYQDVIYKVQTGGAQPHIHAKDIYPLEVLYTTDTKEQSAIVQILTDMDNEIGQLENERQKYTSLKQGTMQQLLTGQIRLKNAPAQSQRIAEIRSIPVDAHVVGGHIVKFLYGSRGWGRTKLQKSMHLVGYCCQLDFGNEYIRNTAGPDDQMLMKHLDTKFKQFRHVRIESENNGKGGKHYNYIPTPMIAEVEQAFGRYPIETQNGINGLLGKIRVMDLPRAEIVSTLYAVWNNRMIKGQPVDDDLLLEDFYDWSEHKSDFSRDLVLRALVYMRREGIVPVGWGKYIDRK